MDGGAWWAAIHGVAKSWTQLSNFTFTSHFHALEKEMATHSCSCLGNPRDGGAWWAVEREGEGTEIKKRRGPMAHHRHDTQNCCEFLLLSLSTPLSHGVSQEAAAWRGS